MAKITFIIICSLISLSSFSQSEKIKYRKLKYDDFKKYSVNDTSLAVIDFFYTKKDNGAFGQMFFLPATIALATIPATNLIGVGTTFISAPLFLSGGYSLLKYRNKKLYKVLIEYKETRTLPNWVRNKTKKQFRFYELEKIDDEIEKELDKEDEEWKKARQKKKANKKK